jgi:ABC-2 type transport system permease protein
LSVKHNFQQIKSIVQRELTILYSNSSLLLLLFAAPILYSFIYTSVFTNKMERDVPVAVIDNDRSLKSREIIRHLDAHELIRVEGNYTSEGAAYRQLQEFKCMAIIIIPKGFENSLKSGVQAKISISINNTRFMISNDVVKGVNDVLTDLAKNTTVDFFQQNGMSGEDARLIATPIQLNSKLLFNTTESYGDFIIVALLALILQQTLLIVTSVVMAHEKEMNSFPMLLHKASGSILKLMVGKSIFYFVIYCVYAFLFFTFHFQLYKLPFEGSIVALIVLTFVHFIAIILLGLIAGTFFPSKLVTLVVMVFSSYPVFLLSGYSWPIQAFPAPLKVISFLLPQTSYFQGFTIITQNGGALHDILSQIIHIIGCIAVLYIIFTLRVRYLKKHNNYNKAPLMID